MDEDRDHFFISSFFISPFFMPSLAIVSLAIPSLPILSCAKTAGADAASRRDDGSGSKKPARKIRTFDAPAGLSLLQPVIVVGRPETVVARLS